MDDGVWLKFLPVLECSGFRLLRMSRTASGILLLLIQLKIILCKCGSFYVQSFVVIVVDNPKRYFIWMGLRALGMVGVVAETNGNLDLGRWRLQK